MLAIDAGYDAGYDRSENRQLRVPLRNGEGRPSSLRTGATHPVQRVGVDLGVPLRQMSRLVAAVHQAVRANGAWTKAEGAGRWADCLERGPVVAAAEGRLEACVGDGRRVSAPRARFARLEQA